VDGRKLKNQIYFKCKKTAHYRSILDKQGRKTSNRIRKINQKFKNIQDNFLNQTVNFIIKKCKEQNVGTIVLGYNNNFQHKTNMGKKQNQIFSHIAFKQFKQKLEIRCQIHEIDLIIQEESYTSQSSFLDEDILPEYQEKDDEKEEDEVKYEFKGNRVQRGLYETQNGKRINADVNAAANIIRKCKHRFNFELLCKWVQTTPSKIKL
jgi:IS605 OrfB family transposase